MTSCNSLTKYLSRICGCLVVSILALASAAAQEPATPTSANQATSAKDWARDYIADDPLALRDTVSLQDIRDGLASPKRRADVITKHFGKISDATDEQKLDFLRDCLQSEHLDVQQQAAQELQIQGSLEEIVRELLLQYLNTEKPILRKAAIVGLEHIPIPPSSLSADYWNNLLQAISDEDSLVANAAAAQIRANGYDAVPLLLNALKGEHPNSVKIAEILSDIVGSRFQSEAFDVAAMQGPTAKSPTVIGKGTTDVAHSPSTPRSVDPKNPTIVKVYYGTNRELIDRPRPGWFQILPYPFIAVLLIVAVITFIQAGPKDSDKPKGCTSRLIPLLMILGAIWASLNFRSELQQHWRLGVGPSFGPRREATEVVHYGTCEVSIPPKHDVGAVERPVIGPENEQEHVVLQKTESLEEEAFFASIREQLSNISPSEKSCFVFIHGFNVDFENAARRTAQIHYDLKFEGVPIFFSWPSRANLRHYFSDRNEIEFSRYVIKQFLTDVAARSDAQRIHVIAHSMGADATCRAIAEMGDKGKVFDQIVLAAPDIDREVFRRQIAPRLTKTANRTTLYCSKNDLALMLSRNFNDATRAGDSSQGALVIQDVDTVDASEIDTDLLGHSYYGDCIPLLHDVHDLLRGSLSPEQRNLRPWPVDDGLQYWTLPDTEEDPISSPSEPSPISAPQ
jgi:esterase/lipase superfamily enzyme